MLQPYLAEIRRLLNSVFFTYGVVVLWVMFFTLSITVLGESSSLLSLGNPLSVSLKWMLDVPLISALAERPWVMLFMMLVYAPFVEEAVFRMLPLALFKNSHPHLIRAVIVCFCGIFFGRLHGSAIHVFIQGFVGMMLGFLYLKNSKNQLSAYLTCVAVHAAYNFTTIAITFVG